MNTKNDKIDLGTNLTYQMWDFADVAFKARVLEAMESGVSRYPIYRDLRLAARMELDALFDAFASRPDWVVQRFDSRSAVIDSGKAFVVVRTSRKSAYCSCYFSIWADSPQNAEAMKTSIYEIVGSALVQDPMFSIAWYFLTSKSELEDVTIEEFADDVLHDEAYPELEGGVEHFIQSYLKADETVLVLQGPPGTGKTRLIRRILSEISKSKKGEASAMYTGDKKTLEGDEIFVKFITGWDDAFVVEDADHLLKPRESGNEHLHRFLTIADGVVKAQGRKIIFSTNLPNIHDLDEALIRPGRCFARCNVRELNFAEAEKLVYALTEAEPNIRAAVTEKLRAEKGKTLSLAVVYKAIRDAKSVLSTPSS